MTSFLCGVFIFHCIIVIPQACFVFLQGREPTGRTCCNVAILTFSASFFVNNKFFFLVEVADDSGEITWDGYRTTDQRSRAHLLKNPRRRDDFQLHLPRQSGKLKHDIFLNLTMFFFVPELHENTALKTFKENICRNVHCQHLNSFSRSKPRVILEKILWSSTRWADPGEDIE